MMGMTGILNVPRGLSGAMIATPDSEARDLYGFEPLSKNPRFIQDSRVSGKTWIEEERRCHGDTGY